MRRGDRGRLTALAAGMALVLAACGAATPSASAADPSPTTGASAGSTVAPTPTPTLQPTASPLPTPAPSTLPTDGPLVRVRFQGHTSGPITLWNAAVNWDGRVVWLDANHPELGRLERQLSASGLALVASAIEGEPALRAAGEYPLQPIEGTDPGGHGRAFWIFTAWPHSGAVEVSAEDLQGLGAYYLQPPEGERLSALAAQLTAPMAWLPADAWAAPAATWVPDDYLVRIGLAPSENPVGTPLADLGLPFDVRTVGTGDDTSRCALLGADQLPGLAGTDGAVLQLAWPEQQLTVSLTVIPRLEGDPGCAG